MDRYSFSLSKQINRIMAKARAKAPEGFIFNENAAFKLYDAFRFFAQLFIPEYELGFRDEDFGMSFWAGQLSGGEYPIKILVELPELLLTSFLAENFAYILRHCVDYFSVCPVEGCKNIQIEVRINGAYIPCD